MFSTGTPLLGAGSEPSAWLSPVQAFDAAAVVEAPASVRAAVVFVLTVAFGGAVIYRYGGRLDAAVEASMRSPIRSVVYGLIAYGLVGFFLAYGYTQLLRVGVGTTAITVVAVAVLGSFLFGLGGLGFAVVGLWFTRALGARDPWIGLVGVGFVGALALFALPFAAGVLVWLGIAAVGVGGPTRTWMHAEAVDVETG
jgi:hypothetical protein